MKGVKKLTSDIISQWTEDVMYGWPPDCVGPLYQPERPVAMTKDVFDDVENVEQDLSEQTK